MESKEDKKKKNGKKKTPGKSAQAQWIRVETGGFHAAAVDRIVDDSAIEKLLTERSKAKVARDFKRADKIAALLQDMDICYVDEKRVWYTRAVGSQRRRGEKREHGAAEEGKPAKKKK